MNGFGLGTYALSGGVAVTLLAGCGDLQPPHTMPAALQQSTRISTDYKKQSNIFKYTGSKQTFEVPSGVKWIAVVALGAAGGGPNGGKGGRVRAMIPVTAGERFTVFVGGRGLERKGGFNGGGRGGAKRTSDAFGGGASGLRHGGEGLASRVLVVGGGGGEGASHGGDDANRLSYDAGSGGSGGGSVAGSGGAGAPGSGRGGGGGGGGSSYVESDAKDVHSWQGWKDANGNGVIVISWQ